MEGPRKPYPHENPAGPGHEERYLPAGGRPVRNQYVGFAIRRASFDACGREAESRYLDEDEKPIRLNKEYAVIKNVYDEGNNVVDKAYLDEREQRIRIADGYARVKREFDRHGNIIGAVFRRAR